MRSFLDYQLIDIFQVAEDQEFADYIFCCGLWVPDELRAGKYRQHQTNFGRVRVDKRSGEIELVSAMPDDERNIRAAATIHELKQHWQKGELPRVVQYASG